MLPSETLHQPFESGAELVLTEDLRLAVPFGDVLVAHVGVGFGGGGFLVELLKRGRDISQGLRAC